MANLGGRVGHGVQPENSVARLPYRRHAVRCHHDGACMRSKLGHSFEATGTKVLITDGQCLVHEQDLWRARRGDSKTKTLFHTGRIRLEWQVDEFTNLGELDDILFYVENLRRREAQPEQAQSDVAPPAQFAV